MSRARVRRIAFAASVALCVALAFVATVAGFSDSYLVGLLERVALFASGALVLGWLAFAIASRMAGWEESQSEADFERVVQRAERLARGADVPVTTAPEARAPGDEDFERLVRDALDELPPEFHQALAGVAIVISDGGRERRAYGLYHGDGVSRDNVADRIVVYRDTLLRDFGHDLELLRAQVRRTVRHELAHHLGWNEPGVRGLGL